jgi:hypothetical protein
VPVGIYLSVRVYGEWVDLELPWDPEKSLHFCLEVSLFVFPIISD